SYFPRSLHDALPIFAETLGDASIAHDSPTGTWTIAAGGAFVTVEAGSSHDFRIVSLTSPSRQLWIRNGGPGTLITVNGSTPVIEDRKSTRLNSSHRT